MQPSHQVMVFFVELVTFAPTKEHVSWLKILTAWLLLKRISVNAVVICDNDDSELEWIFIVNKMTI